MSLNDLDAICYINLDHRTDRKERILYELKKYLQKKYTEYQLYMMSSMVTKVAYKVTCSLCKKLSRIDGIEP